MPAQAAPSPQYAASPTPDSVFPQLEMLLPKIQKPIQYVGGELNAVSKAWDRPIVRWALMYPDAYEVGLPNQGVQIFTKYSTRFPTSLPNARTRSGPTSSS